MLTELDLESLHYICFRLREADKAEIFGIMEHDCPYRFGWEAYTVFRNKGRSRIAWYRGKPAACIALLEIRPTVWEVASFGTEDYKAVALEMARWARNNIAELSAPPFNGRRLQCDSRDGHEEAHKYLLALGARKEGEPMLHYGKDGSTYYRFVWVFGKDGGSDGSKVIDVARNDLVMA